MTAHKHTAECASRRLMYGQQRTYNCDCHRPATPPHVHAETKVPECCCWNIALQVDLFDAINEYAESCGADTSKHVYGNTRRMNAVVAVSNALKKHCPLPAAPVLSAGDPNVDGGALYEQYLATLPAAPQGPTREELVALLRDMQADSPYMATRWGKYSGRITAALANEGRKG